ncbi:hypothetical protein MK851_02900 [Tenacibaculum sp. 1B UA]|uniref:hypothetical protein n=1 Tax=unclassified Tenacibaculum TaxID=2635139 RepID=UPI0026E2B62C|nr:MULTISPECIES: hypothetical protein [unclassified Tenacibaculum]MDO6674255.1 hypothetical protein [Tenacibaculum sp. 1_MG-2023]MDX8552571.1 hypothetical protein [Tenacibaculum sp. 1B UA]
MKPVSVKHLWSFPLLFGFLGAIIGLVLRYAFTGSISGFPFKFVLHSHSHIMLLGFVFNALIVLLFTRFTNGIDKISYRLYLALQICVAILLVGFIIQGYALVTIIFSTLHLWISYWLLLRLWKRLQGKESDVTLIKTGIVFHFISSIGPYALGPLMAMKMQTSPWYQQAIFFYLHFQYFGSFFLWMLAVFFQKTAIKLSKNQILLIVFSLILLYAHSLKYSFSYLAIQILGGIGAGILIIILFRLKNLFLHQKLQYQLFFGILLLIGVLNCFGSIPYFSNLVVTNRFMLIAWLHLLFLGMYLPFIWIELNKNIHKSIWISYTFFLLISELFLVSPAFFSELFLTPIMWLLFIAYFGVVLCISIVHLTALFQKNETYELTRTR